MAMIGVPTNWRTPGVISQIIFGTGESLAGGGERSILIIDQKLSTGAWTVNTVIQPEDCRTESQVTTGAGAGSAIHRAWRAVTNANKQIDVYILVVALTTGSAPVAAISKFVLAGATASGDGEIRVDVAEDTGGVVNFYTGEALATISARVRAFVSGKTHLPCTCVGSTGDLDFTAKAVGARWGTTGAATAVRITVTSTGGGITVSGGGNLGATTSGADGSTTEAAQVATALAAIAAARHYYLVYGDAGNTTAMTSLRQYLANSAVAIEDRRMVVIAGSRATKSAVIALANSANYERQVIVHQAGSSWTSEQLAGQLAGTLARYQEGDATHGFVNHSGPDWAVPGAQSEADWPDKGDVSDLINNGVTTITSSSRTKSRMPMLVDTRSKDSSGSFDDFRSCEFHRVSGADFVVDDLEPKLATFQGMKMGTRPNLPDGTPNLNYVFPKGTIDKYVVTPTIIKALKQHENVHLQRLDDTMESLTLERHPNNAGAFIATFTLYIVDINTQVQNDVSEGSAA
jgi:phage tail sheath gpL-like